MKKIQLGKSNLEITKIGLGTWAIGGPWTYGWGPQSEEDSIYAIHEALDLGINWIDTAPAYGAGNAEKIIAKALKAKKKDVYIFTKCGILPGRNLILKKESIKKEVELSLKRLNVEQIDLYQIHWPNPKNDIEEAWETLLELKEEGKIRYAGVCNFSVSQLETISRLGEVTSLQPPYSMLRNYIEKDVLPYCTQTDLGVIAYSPMQAGLLTDKVSKEWVRNLPKDDWRINSGREEMRFIKPEFIEGFLLFLSKLKEIASFYDANTAQLAIAWVLSNSTVSAAIVGARKKGQISDTVKALNFSISDDDLETISKLVKTVSCD